MPSTTVEQKEAFVCIDGTCGVYQELIVWNILIRNEMRAAYVVVISDHGTDQFGLFKNLISVDL